MTAVRREYANCYFVDPEAIESQGRDGAVKLIIGCLMDNMDYLHLEGTPREKSRLVNRSIIGLSHTQAGRKQLQSQASDPGWVWQFYFCWQCGARLEVRRCSGCRRRYKGLSDSDAPSPRQTTLPRKVYDYALGVGHRFQRPRQY